jgi:hypothetical protein
MADEEKGDHSPHSQILLIIENGGQSAPVPAIPAPPPARKHFPSSIEKIVDAELIIAQDLRASTGAIVATETKATKQKAKNDLMKAMMMIAVSDALNYNGYYEHEGESGLEVFQADTKLPYQVRQVAWNTHEGILLTKIYGEQLQVAPTNVKDVVAWKYYWDLKSGKLESVIPLLLGVTVKSIKESEHEGKLHLEATITLKLPIDDRFAENHENLKGLKEQAKELMKGIHINFNMKGNKTLEPRNCKLNRIKDGKCTDYSMSDHLSFDIDASGIVDCCPFNLAKYNLSIKLNALDGDGSRGKVKLVWQSRSPSKFLQFQYTAIGGSVTHNDTICILPKYKREKDLVEFEPQRTPPDSDRVDCDLVFHEVIAEVDELLISFHTKSNQMKNLTNIVLPCMMVPIIVALSSNREDKIQLLLTALLTMVFTMPARFNFGTTCWYLMAMVLTVIAYCEPSSRYSIRWISVLFTGVFLIIAFVRQYYMTIEKKISILELTKDARERSLWEKGWDMLCLD